MLSDIVKCPLEGKIVLGSERLCRPYRLFKALAFTLSKIRRSHWKLLSIEHDLNLNFNRIILAIFFRINREESESWKTS